MKQYSHLLNTNTFSYRASFSYMAFGVMISALFLVYMITVGSITSASFSLNQLSIEKENLIESNLELSYVLGSKISLEYLYKATQSLGLEEISRAVYLELQESGIVVFR